MTLDVLSAVLLLTGAATCFMGAIGLVRFPDLLSRMQAATKPQTMGLLLILLGAALRMDFGNAMALLLVGLFQVVTAPVVAQLVARSAYRSGTVRRDLLVSDELADRLRPPGGSSSPADGDRRS